MKLIALFLLLLNFNLVYASGTQHKEQNDHEGHDHDHAHDNLEKHVHGEVQLLIAVEKNIVDILIEGPSEAFIGFEHKPKSKKEKKIYKKFYDMWMKDGNSLFKFPTAAKCSPRGSKIDWKGKKGAKHADISLAMKYFCSPPVENNKVEVDFASHFKNLQVLKVDVLPLTKMPYSKEFKKKKKISLDL